MTEMDAPKERRLNPFAFPSETNVRFTLLIAAALMLTFDIVFGVGLATGFIKAPEWDQALTQSVIVVGVPGGFLLAVLVLATIIYLGHPRRTRRAKNLQVMNRHDDPQFLDAVQELVSLSGISPAPRIEVAAGSRSVDGQAFGFRNQYALRLGGRLRLLLRQNPANFRAIVLHELGHLANADVTRTYFAQSILIAFVILVIIPMLAFIAFNFIDGFIELISSGPDKARWIRLFTKVIPTIFILLFQIGSTLAIVAAVRSSLLRVREVYADWRAALWGAGDSLADILRHHPPEDKTGRWPALWRLHPTSQERLNALVNPKRLFRVSSEVPFFVGTLLPYALMGAVLLCAGLVLVILAGAGVSLQSLILGLDHWSTNPPQWFENFNNEQIYSILALPIFLIIFIMIATILITILAVGGGIVYLVAGALGLEVQREAVVDLISGNRGWISYFKLWRPAVLVAIGFQTGILLIPYYGLGLLPELVNSRGLIILMMVFLLTVTNAFLTWLWLVYLRFFARRILGSHAGISSPQGARRLLTFASSGLLLMFYLPPVVLGYIDISALASGQTIIITRWVGALAIITMGIMFQYVVIFISTWLVVQTHRFFRQSHCPACKQVTKKRYAVGEECEHCGNDLAPWLYVNESPSPS